MFGGVGHTSLLVSCGFGGAASCGGGLSAVFFLSLAPAYADEGTISGSASASASSSSQPMRIEFGRDLIMFVLRSRSYFDKDSRFLWQVSQNAMLLAWSFTSRSGCADACGWWQVMQSMWVFTLVMSAGSITSCTGWPSIGCPSPYLMGRMTTLFFWK